MLSTLSGGALAQADTTGLAGWVVQGDVVARSGSLLLTTAYAAPGDPDQPDNLSGQDTVDIALIEAAAGLAAYALDLQEPDYAVEGSLVTQSFAVAAGDVLRFDWTFSTREDLFLDHAFAVIDGQVYTLATTAAPGAALQSFSHRYTQAGWTTLSLGVVDTGDVLGVSTLGVANLGVTAVPEPGTWALWLTGLAGLGALARRRR